MVALPDCAREDALRKKTALFGLYQRLLKFIFWVSGYSCRGGRCVIAGGNFDQNGGFVHVT